MKQKRSFLQKGEEKSNQRTPVRRKTVVSKEMQRHSARRTESRRETPNKSHARRQTNQNYSPVNTHTMQQKQVFSIFLAFWMALVSGGTELSAATQTKANANQIKLTNTTEQVVRKQITFGGSTENLLESSDILRVGVTDYDGRKLKDYQTLLFDKIRVGYSTHADPGKEAFLGYDDTIPDILLNSYLVIKQGNREIINLPISAIANNFVKTKLEDYYAELDNITYLVDSSPIEMYLQFPDDTVDPDASVKHYLYVGLKGYSTKEV